MTAHVGGRLTVAKVKAAGPGKHPDGRNLWLQVGPFTYFSIPSPKALWNAKHHRDILRALKADDGDAAADAITQDILNTAKFLQTSGHFTRPHVRRFVDLAA